MAGLAAVAVGIVAGSQLADPGDPLVDPSPTPVPSPTVVEPTPSPSLSPSPSSSPSPSPDAEAPTVETAVISSTTEPSDGRPAIEVDVAHPQLTGLRDEQVQAEVNRAIAEAMEAEVADFLAMAEEPADGDTPPYSIWSRVTVAAVDPVVFSAVVPITTYLGGAHPFTVVRTFTFDLSTGQEVQLTDLFDEGILERVSAIAIERIQEEYGTGDWAEEGAAPTSEALASFVLTADHLQLWFDNYEVGPYAIGTPSVDIAYDELADLVPSDGVVAHLAGEA